MGGCIKLPRKLDDKLTQAKSNIEKSACISHFYNIDTDKCTKPLCFDKDKEILNTVSNIEMAIYEKDRLSSANERHFAKINLTVCDQYCKHVYQKLLNENDQNYGTF